MQQIDKSLRETGSEYKLLKTNLENGFSTEKWSRAKPSARQSSDAEKKPPCFLPRRLRELESSGEYGDDTAEVIRQLNRGNHRDRKRGAAGTRPLKEIDELRMNQIKSTSVRVSAALDSVGKKLTLGVTARFCRCWRCGVVQNGRGYGRIDQQVDVAFGDAADSVHAFSNETLTTYGIAKSTTLDMAGYFGDMATSMGFSREQAAEMSSSWSALPETLHLSRTFSLSKRRPRSLLFSPEKRKASSNSAS